jgi:hypothetical protein
MVTTRNSVHRDTAISDGEGNLLLDEFILILKSSEHVPSANSATLKYVHEKPRCCNICENGTGVKPASYKKTLEAELMVNNEIAQGGKLFVC